MMLEDARMDTENGVPGSTGAFRIWPGVAPGAETWDWTERTAPVFWQTFSQSYARNVTTPTLTLFQPSPGTANGTAVIIAPGGAFHFLMLEHEGHDMARWLNELGITAFVLKYRLARTPDRDEDMPEFRESLGQKLAQARWDDAVPADYEFFRTARLAGEEDGRQAIRFVREHAAEWGLDPERIGIAGFSAGGGVAMGASMQYDPASRPDFAIGIYPAYRAELTVPSDAPPLFLAISDDDPTVPSLSSSRLYDLWKASGASAEFHVFANGGHGWGMGGADFLSATWTMLLQNWLVARGMLGA
jgi:acetyl esterase/lipase